MQWALWDEPGSNLQIEPAFGRSSTWLHGRLWIAASGQEGRKFGFFVEASAEAFAKH